MTKVNKVLDFFKRHEKIIIAIFLLISFVSLFLTYQTKEFSGDDLAYMKKWGSELPLSSFSDIIEYQYNHFLSWGGRTIAHTIVQILFLIGKPISAVINSIVFMLLAYLVYYYSFNEKKLNYKYFGILGLFYVLNPTFTETMIWYTGSANYMWMTCIVLFAMKPFIEIIRKDQYKLSIVDYISILFSFFAGWSNENVAPVMILLMIFALWYRRKDKKYYVLIIPVILMIIGCCLLLLAPGNFVRAQEFTGLFASIFRRLHGQIYAWCLWPFPLILLFIISYYVVKKCGLKLDMITKVFFVVGCLQILAMIASPYYPSRASFCSFIFFLMANLNILKLLIQSQKIDDDIVLLCSILLWISFVGSLATIWSFEVRSLFK